MAKKILAVLLVVMALCSVCAVTVSASQADAGYYADTEFDVGFGTEDTVEEESKTCVGGATALPFYGVVIAGALLLLKKRV